MRVYLPLTLALLAEADRVGEVPASVDKLVAEDESEAAEYAALMTAADVSAELIDRPGRRVVLAADVVEMAGAVPKKAWAAVHVDTADDADPDDDLAWYATQEISDLLAGR
ncbi:DUF6912 family protein [Nocardioides sp.]|uniref:DUF6912 family protein n=1 Tax=Nocardioides sp. TaxID=35761 RepID=UPI00286E1EBA|nr:hypothetical protein [Nocardioides sp.]